MVLHDEKRKVNFTFTLFFQTANPVFKLHVTNGKVRMRISPLNLKFTKRQEKLIYFPLIYEFFGIK